MNHFRSQSFVKKIQDACYQRFIKLAKFANFSPSTSLFQNNRFSEAFFRLFVMIIQKCRNNIRKKRFNPLAHIRPPFRAHSAKSITQPNGDFNDSGFAKPGPRAIIVSFPKERREAARFLDKYHAVLYGAARRHNRSTVSDNGTAAAHPTVAIIAVVAHGSLVEDDFAARVGTGQHTHRVT